MVGRTENDEVSVMRDTIRLVLSIAKRCNTLEELIQELEKYLKES